jgi:hypothetical protein
MRRWSLRLLPILLTVLVAALPLATRLEAQWQIATQDGKSTIKFGFLAQPQGEWIETADGEHTSQNLFLRRLRLITGGTIGEQWSFFIETDSPNLGKSTGDTDPKKSKDQGNLYLQDVILTWSSGDALKVDAGMLLIPVSHNTQQGAGSLLPVDYGPYSFLHSDPTTSRVGRDYGIQVRGYPFGKHMEYRAGVFQGYRGQDAAKPMRTVARAVWYPFEADTGFFYTGTTMGAKKILSVGASLDHQGGYQAVGADVFYDQPIAGGDGLTLQGNFIRYDGGDFFPGSPAPLPRQDALLLEGGYYVHSVRLGPFVQWAMRDLRDSALPDEEKRQIGLAYWRDGHRMNLKLAWARLTKDGLPDRDQIVLQAQIFMY